MSNIQPLCSTAVSPSAPETAIQEPPVQRPATVVQLTDSSRQSEPPIAADAQLPCPMLGTRLFGMIWSRPFFQKGDDDAPNRRETLVLQEESRSEHPVLRSRVSQSPDSETDREPMSKERTFTLVQAAAATGVSRMTIRRHLDAGRFPNAVQDRVSAGGGLPPWRIPLGDLLAAGLTVDPASMTEPNRPSWLPTPATPEATTEVIARLREELGAHKAIAAERARMIELLSQQAAELRQVLAEALATQRGGRQ